MLAIIIFSPVGRQTFVKFNNIGYLGKKKGWLYLSILTLKPKTLPFSLIYIKVLS